VIASTLLGVYPPRLPSQLLVRSGELFGINEGTTRTAISRMVAAGELEADEGAYRLAGSLLARQSRQDASRRADVRPWSGDWEMEVVVGDRRPAAARAELREAMRRLKLVELREGVWLRPDNLDGGRLPEDRSVVRAQCTTMAARPTDDPGLLAATLWDLESWATTADDLRRRFTSLIPGLTGGDTDLLAEGFVVSAAVLRLLLADPLLPTELLPRDWPGVALRVDYERYDETFKTVWRDWFRTQMR
jgi:phenylacetic acid degradation operon negative regulatory protein